MKQGKILVVDDEYGIRTGVRQILEMKGFTVTEAETGREALLRHKALKEDALLDGSEQGLIRQPVYSVLATEKRSDRPGRDDGPRPPQRNLLTSATSTLVGIPALTPGRGGRALSDRLKSRPGRAPGPPTRRA